MPYLEIARECGISGAAIHQRIKKLEDMGVIMGSRLVVAPKSLGFDVCAFISIRVSDVKRQQDTVEQLRKIPEIVECHYITGSYNLMVKLYCVDNEHLMRTIFDHILQVQGVSSTQTYISLNESFQREIHVDCLDD
jgi:Lrp/AsnC family transcriptional regulator for asnA, asnC and gidA